IAALPRSMSRVHARSPGIDGLELRRLRGVAKRHKFQSPRRRSREGHATRHNHYHLPLRVVGDAAPPSRASVRDPSSANTPRAPLRTPPSFDELPPSFASFASTLDADSAGRSLLRLHDARATSPTTAAIIAVIFITDPPGRKVGAARAARVPPR